MLEKNKDVQNAFVTNQKAYQKVLRWAQTIDYKIFLKDKKSLYAAGLKFSKDTNCLVRIQIAQFAIRFYFGA